MPGARFWRSSPCLSCFSTLEHSVFPGWRQLCPVAAHTHPSLVRRWPLWLAVCWVADLDLLAVVVVKAGKSRTAAVLVAAVAALLAAVDSRVGLFVRLPRSVLLEKGVPWLMPHRPMNLPLVTVLLKVLLVRDQDRRHLLIADSIDPHIGAGKASGALWA